jgi:hypothetical protein
MQELFKFWHFLKVCQHEIVFMPDVFFFFKSVTVRYVCFIISVRFCKYCGDIFLSIAVQVFSTTVLYNLNLIPRIFSAYSYGGKLGSRQHPMCNNTVEYCRYQTRYGQKVHNHLQ